MTLEALLSLALAIFVIGAIPGPAVLLVSTRTLQAGLAAGIAVITGIVLVDLILLIVSLTGLSVVAGISPATLKFFSLIGAGFLIYLAWQSWNSTGTTQTKDKTTTQLKNDFIAGIFISLSNPIFLYLALLPTFIDLPKISILDILGLVILVGFILVGTLAAYALIACKLGKVFSESKIKLLNKLGAIVLLILSGIILLS